MDRSVISKLLDCTKAIEGGDLNHADSLFKEILIANEATDDAGTSKVVKYFAEALVRRLYKLYPQDHRPMVHFKDFEGFLKYGYLPFIWFANFTTHDSLAEAIIGKKRVHFIDFAFTATIWQYFHLMEKLVSQPGGALSYRITFIGPKDSRKGNYLEEIRRLLTVAAQKFHIGFEFTELEAYSAADIVNSTLKLGRTNEDEMVIVKWEFELHKLLPLPGAIDLVLSKLKLLKPEIMVIVEQDTNNNSPDFTDWLDQSLVYYHNIFDALEDTYYELDDHKLLWEVFFRRQICNVVAREGTGRVDRHETGEQWQNRMRHAGFRPVRLKFKEGSLYFTFPQYKIIEKKRCPLLSRHNHLLACASAWKPDPNQLNDGLVDDLEAMFAGVNIAQDAASCPEIGESRSHHEGDNSRMMMDGNIRSAEYFSINQIAASAEIFDLLEYVCHEHDLPLALTWISDWREDNTNLTGKHILRIENTACYVNDFTMREFVEKCGKNHLEEGQGIAGKALISNSTMHFISDVSELDVDDYPYVYEAWEFGLHAAVAIKLGSTYFMNTTVNYVVEIFLPIEMREISEEQLLITEILSTLRRQCGNSWIVCGVESNTGDNMISEGSIDQDARMPNFTPAPVAISNTIDIPTPISSTEVQFETGGTSTCITEVVDGARFEEGGSSNPIATLHNSSNCPPTLLDIDLVRSFLMNSPTDNEQAADQVAAQDIDLAMCRQEFEQILAIETEVCANAGSNKRRRRSEVWIYFDIEVRENGEAWGKCKGCGAQYRAESTRGTSNFKRHLCSCPGIKLMRGA